MVKVCLDLGFILFHRKHCNSESVVTRNATFCHNSDHIKKTLGYQTYILTALLGYPL